MLLLLLPLTQPCPLNGSNRLRTWETAIMQLLMWNKWNVIAVPAAAQQHYITSHCSSHTLISLICVGFLCAHTMGCLALFVKLLPCKANANGPAWWVLLGFPDARLGVGGSDSRMRVEALRSASAKWLLENKGSEPRLRNVISHPKARKQTSINQQWYPLRGELIVSAVGESPHLAAASDWIGFWDSTGPSSPFVFLFLRLLAGFGLKDSTCGRRTCSSHRAEGKNEVSFLRVDDEWRVAGGLVEALHSQVSTWRLHSLHPAPPVWNPAASLWICRPEAGKSPADERRCPRCWSLLGNFWLAPKSNS